MKQVQLHINDIVEVTLTQDGVNAYDKYHDHLPIQLKPKSKNVGDTVQEPLWQIMAMFGPYIYHGGENLFHPNGIRFAEKALVKIDG